MRYELNDYERRVIQPMLPNKPRGVLPPDMTNSPQLPRLHQACSCPALDTGL
jgi:hypothetical protein